MVVDLYPHQKKAVKELHNGSILCGGVGTGKSRVAFQYYIENEWESDVYVITTAKKRDSFDWSIEASQHGVGTTRDATLAGVLTVDSWNNLSKYKEIENAFFIFDEQRLVGAGTWTKAFLKIAKSNRWILLSATPGDTWMDYIPVFVANGFYRNRTEFIREHVVYNRYAKFPKVDRYVGVSRLIKQRNKLLVDMPYERHTTRIFHTVHLDYDKQLYERSVTKRWNPYEEAPMKDVSELCRVTRRIVNSNESRLKAVKKLMELHPRLIVFYNFDYELETLRTLETSHDSSNPKTSKTMQVSSLKMSSQCKCQEEECPLGTRQQDGSVTTPHGSTGAVQKTESFTAHEKQKHVSFAEWNGHNHEEVPKTERWVYLVQYMAGAEGWNCVSTDAIIFYSLTYSYRNFAQAQGRIDRLNTPYFDLHYYIFKTDSSIDQGIWKALKGKKNFNENSFNA